MNKKELRNLSVELLKEETFKLGQEKFKLEAQHATHQLTATHRLRAVRRLLARSLTILHENMGQKI
ncbi:50S ribosomal protein L29 [Candidatus Rickettsiella isopodorum]|jgi:large subunit ribosomal protein L29|uniref:Large ribosomal subunit protein uL29 n=1 Tax=Candidatus Rickettsiella isopodorum TaxID=1225476 RepID=A0A1J8NFG3_9COXI|nr:50S ribosomal protein L29 [Candidatus Rickettsiella isopodorum]MCH9636999.1 50S ribosomal protein L29 [Gammaproteobacteria bacterium]MDQ5899529.1 large subunit ribosomal protein [Pseudomonadota bacterium]MCH9755349.1 50S ribosomal protein L29 [Gammaproteobacteria bacterium]MDD4892841.1 50S ribosomal protein L29 [Candidatus Rickettsiella isopodorum]MDD5162027.1 50S ribosomal protein L29 [Candidatus Rickettsiella isopodorum]